MLEACQVYDVIRILFLHEALLYESCSWMMYEVCAEWPILGRYIIDFNGESLMARSGCIHLSAGRRAFV